MGTARGRRDAHGLFLKRLVDPDEWHDWETLAAIASEPLANGARCLLFHAIRTTLARQYDRALALTNRMRTTALAGPSDAAAVGRGCPSVD